MINKDDEIAKLKLDLYMYREGYTRLLRHVDALLKATRLSPIQKKFVEDKILNIKETIKLEYSHATKK